MRAIVLREFDARPVYEANWPEPVPGPNDALIRVRAVGVGLTILIMLGTPGLVTGYPRIPGHEIAGEVVAVGSEVKHIQVGQRATCHFFRTCGQCRFCRSGRESLCENFSGFVGMACDGGYADYVALPARNLVPIPDGVSDLDAAISADAIATAFHACTRKGQIAPGEDVMVIGAAGGVGIHVVQMAKVCGGHVVAVDVGEEKLAFARKWGADETIDAAGKQIAEEARRLTGGRGVDVVIDVVGSRETLQASLAALGVGGRLVMVGFRPKGMFGAEWNFTVDGFTLNRGELAIHGSRYVSHSEIRETLNLVQKRQITPVVSRTFALADVEEAHVALKQAKTLGRLALVL